MNTKLHLLALVLTLATVAPVHADTVADQIRDQGRAAVQEIGTEIRHSAIGAPAPAKPEVSVEEAIRAQGELAVRSVAIEITLRFHGRHGPTVAATL